MVVGCCTCNIWEIARMRGTFLAVPLIRILVFGVYIGIPSLWKLTCGPYSKLLVSPLLTPIVDPYMIPHPTPLKGV